MTPPCDFVPPLTINTPGFIQVSRTADIRCRAVVSTTDEKWFFRNLDGRKWMKLSGEQRSKLF
ncbi:hypothetical protein GE242_20735 [Escherichia coli]|nr:hypothetical protein [Escherichia coli]TDE76405.1 hypothetical protein E0D98_18365 [Escherichia sp. KCJ4928]EFC4231026.1 hypothetical protein [Escherichia coli]EFE0068421.1 hypothetical protein [Escherichia coli]EFE7186904.1 hypothetical protein [Escherichia coli]